MRILKFPTLPFLCFTNFLSGTIDFISRGPFGFNVSSRIQNCHTMNFKMTLNSLVFHIPVAPPPFASHCSPPPAPPPLHASVLYESLACPHSSIFLLELK